MCTEQNMTEIRDLLVQLATQVFSQMHRDSGGPRLSQKYCPIYFWIALCFGQVPTWVIWPGQPMHKAVKMKPASLTVQHAMHMLYDITADAMAVLIQKMEAAHTRDTHIEI